MQRNTKPIQRIVNRHAKNNLLKATQSFYHALANEPGFPGTWLDGFLNCIQYGHSSDDWDNTYSPNEEPAYSNYKAGAKAAEILLALPPDH